MIADYISNPSPHTCCSVWNLPFTEVMKPNIPSGFSILILLQCDLARCYRILPISSLLASAPPPSPSPSLSSSGASSSGWDDVSSEYEYDRARKVRIKQCHDSSALPIWTSLQQLVFPCNFKLKITWTSTKDETWFSFSVDFEFTTGMKS